jgi:transcriptional regulator with XRE-family HTH domain
MRIIDVDGIRKIAKKRGISQKQMADYLGITETTVSKIYKKGKNARRINVIAFNTAIREIIKGQKLSWDIKNQK